MKGVLLDSILTARTLFFSPIYIINVILTNRRAEVMKVE